MAITWIQRAQHALEKDLKGHEKCSKMALKWVKIILNGSQNILKRIKRVKTALKCTETDSY